jgi:hypothetical protein
MRVTLFKGFAMVRNEVGEVAEINGFNYRLLIREYARRKSLCKKSERTILAEIVQGWTRESLEWKEPQEAG